MCPKYQQGSAPVLGNNYLDELIHAEDDLCLVSLGWSI